MSEMTRYRASHQYIKSQFGGIRGAHFPAKDCTDTLACLALPFR